MPVETPTARSLVFRREDTGAEFHAVARFLERRAWPSQSLDFGGFIRWSMGLEVILAVDDECGQ